jgi:hypothetical protein
MIALGTEMSLIVSCNRDADIYAHVLPELEHAAILRMDKLLG